MELTFDKFLAALDVIQEMKGLSNLDMHTLSKQASHKYFERYLIETTSDPDSSFVVPPIKWHSS